MSARRGIACLLCAIAVAVASYARAERDERLDAIADPISALAERAVDASVIELNGQRLRVSAFGVAELPGNVLRRFDASCAAGAPALSEQLRHVAAPPLAADALDEAAAACLVHPTDSGSGQLRYVRTHRTAQGTHVLYVQSESPLSLHDMFPERGDASGHDFVDLPRPRGSRRVLSAQLYGQAHGIVAYASASPEQPATALQRYTHELGAQGFRQLIAADDHATATFSHGEASFVVHAAEHAGETTISAVRIASGSTP